MPETLPVSEILKYNKVKKAEFYKERWYSALVGQNMGAGKTERAEKTVKVSALAGFIFLTMMGFFMFFLAEFLSSFFNPRRN